jgi:ABC-2 type transport system permease protein
MTTSAPAVSRPRSVPRAGWMVVARKEFADHLLSIRFVVLLLIVGGLAALPLYLTADLIRQAPGDNSGTSALFVALFWYSPAVLDNQFTLPSVVGFLTLVAPLLGLVFGFDAVNGERAQGTLPRLLSQPIHRDDVINGKFAAGLAIIALVLVAVVLLISGIGLFRLGIVPAAPELLRIVIWLLVTFLYVSLWLAFGMVLSVVIRRAASSALIGFGVWFLLTLFGGLIVGFVSRLLYSKGSSTADALQNQGIEELVNRFLPATLYSEASRVLLNPLEMSRNISTPTTVEGYRQAQQQIPSLLSLDQSFIVVWPQIVGLVAMTVICFAVAYILFMRQEVRA